ncbi:MAG TPA: YbaN family protein [Salinivirgaceae bacterium]|nr:YbaN family protein [Salinivirgaceae bacterium]
MKKWIFIFMGLLCTAIGIVGIFIPLLPTTPLLLAALFFFTHSSPKLKRKLLSYKMLEKYVEPYINNQPVPKSTKIRTIMFLWLALSISAIFVCHKWWLLLILLAVGIGVTAHIAKLK